MSLVTINQYVSYWLVMLNVGFVAFVAAAPQGTLPWWAIAAFAAVNAVVHALPTKAADPTPVVSK